MFLLPLLTTTAVVAAGFNLLADKPDQLSTTSATTFAIAVFLSWAIRRLLRPSLEERFGDPPQRFLLSFHATGVALLGVLALCRWAPPATLVGATVLGVDLALWWGEGLRRLFKPRLAD